LDSRSPATSHLITGEYPPQSGGVSDYSYLVATGLAKASEKVHVWAPWVDDPTRRRLLASAGLAQARLLCDPVAILDRLHGLLVAAPLEARLS